MRRILLILLISNITMLCQSIEFIGSPALFAPGIVSVESSEVKITFSKDGKLVLWGEIGRETGIGGFDIWQALKTDTGWSNPQPVSFNSPDNDFDPSFSADGKTLYFFSNRPGGFRGDDIYYVSYDSATQTFGTPKNMGMKINTSGDEWGPIESPDGKKFIFCTDGLNGKGMHDIYTCDKVNDGWDEPINLYDINSEEDDFDPIFLNDCKTILFTRKINEDEAYLFISFLSNKGYTKPEKISKEINMNGTWNFGSSLDPIDNSYFYYSTRNKDYSMGRLDIFKVKYNLLH